MRLSFSGDLYVEEGLENFNVDKAVEDLYVACDYNFVCFEAPYFKDPLMPYNKVGPNLRQNKCCEDILKYFTHASLANNHSMDYGYDGCLQTKYFLRRADVVPIGVSEKFPDMYEPLVIVDAGLKLAVFALCEAQYGCCKSQYENNGGYGWILNPLVLKMISEYKKQVDYVIVFAHAGLEDVDCPLQDWRIAYRNLIDFGADAVIASHPHRIQGKEFYRGKYIYYSLGNFFFNGQCADLSNDDFTTSLVLELDIDATGINYIERFVRFSESGIYLLTSDNMLNKFNEMNNLLKQEYENEYMKHITNIICNVWNQEYRFDYSYPIFIQKKGVSLLKRMFNKLLECYVHRCFMPPVSFNKIFHNLNTDTNRFVTTRYCMLKENTY